MSLSNNSKPFLKTAIPQGLDAADSRVGLQCRGLTKSFGARPVLNSIDLSVLPGTALGLIGENGAGKSTLNLIIAGALLPDAGKMSVDGAAYAPLSPSEALHRGVALIHQEIRLLPGLTVAENMFLGRLLVVGGRIDRKRMAKIAQEELDALGVRVDARRFVAGLSMGVQQGIEIAKAIIRKPRYIIFDEPTASLGKADAELVLAQIRELKAQGTGIIYISHRLDEVREIADTVMCLRDGDLAAKWDKRPFVVQDMINAMVGRDFEFEHHAPPPRSDRVALSVSGLTRAGAFKDVSFELLKGEILGFAGLIGAGRTEVARVIAGADVCDAGEIRVEGTVVKYKSPKQAIKAGVFMVPEDRKGQGLLLEQKAAENIALPWETSLKKFGLVLRSEIAKVGQAQKQRFDVRGDLSKPIGRMSGGNQQKVLIAKWLVQNPKVLIFDEPTRGVDVGAKMAIYEIIRKLAADGIAIIVISSELEEVLGLSHRVLVMSEGRQRGILSRGEATPASVMSLAVGT